jgi:hypothetical protein
LLRPGAHSLQLAGVSEHAPAHEPSTRGVRQLFSAACASQRHAAVPLAPGGVVALAGHARQTPPPSNRPGAHSLHCSRWFAEVALSLWSETLRGSCGVCELPAAHLQLATPSGIAADASLELFPGHGRHAPGGSPSPRGLSQLGGVTRVAQ